MTDDIIITPGRPLLARQARRPGVDEEGRVFIPLQPAAHPDLAGAWFGMWRNGDGLDWLWPEDVEQVLRPATTEGQDRD